jgi:hypothetical protein
MGKIKKERHMQCNCRLFNIECPYFLEARAEIIENFLLVFYKNGRLEKYFLTFRLQKFLQEHCFSKDESFSKLVKFK